MNQIKAGLKIQCAGTGEVINPPEVQRRIDMEKLFNDIRLGLLATNWKELGGGNLFCIMEKEDKRIKLFTQPNYDNPEHIIVRYA